MKKFTVSHNRSSNQYSTELHKLEKLAAGYDGFSGCERLFFPFFFAVSVIVFGTLMFVAGSLVSGAFAGLHFMLWSRKRERRLSELQVRVNDLESQQEQLIVQPPLPLAPMVGEGPGDQDLGYQSLEE